MTPHPSISQFDDTAVADPGHPPARLATRHRTPPAVPTGIDAAAVSSTLAPHRFPRVVDADTIEPGQHLFSPLHGWHDVDAVIRHGDTIVFDLGNDILYVSDIRRTETIAAERTVR